MTGIRNIIRIRQYDSPCGSIVLGSFGEMLCMCDWQQSGRRHEYVCGRLSKLLDAEFEYGSSPVTELAKKQLDEYFAGTLRVFDMPVLFVGTAFQKSVWETLRGIPYGHTVSYREIAGRIGMPHAVRAVANAVGANPISIFVPCHRVIGSDGSLTGYAGGLDAKLGLLRLEGVSFAKDWDIITDVLFLQNNFSKS